MRTNSSSALSLGMLSPLTEVQISQKARMGRRINKGV